MKLSARDIAAALAADRIATMKFNEPDQATMKLFDIMTAVMNSDGVVLMYEGGGVCLAEAVKFGAAIMAGKRVVVVAIGDAVPPRSLARAAAAVIKARSVEHANSDAMKARIFAAIEKTDSRARRSGVAIRQVEQVTPAAPSKRGGADPLRGRVGQS